MTPREMSTQCQWADQAIENGEMTDSHAFSWLCQQWDVNEAEALEDLGSTDIYALLGYAAHPDTSFIHSLGPDDDGTTEYAFNLLMEKLGDE